MTSKTCLRCDWHGETAELACPSCAQRPLYVMSAPPSTSLEAASDRPTVRTDPSPPSADPTKPPRRPARSAAVVVVAALAAVGMSIGITALRSDEAPPQAAVSAALRAAHP